MSEHLELHQLVDRTNHRRFRSPFTRIAAAIKSCSFPHLGIMLAALSSLFFSLCSVIVKGLVDVNPMELASFR